MSDDTVVDECDQDVAAIRTRAAVASPLTFVLVIAVLALTVLSVLYRRHVLKTRKREAKASKRRQAATTQQQGRAGTQARNAYARQAACRPGGVTRQGVQLAMRPLQR